MLLSISLFNYIEPHPLGEGLSKFMHRKCPPEGGSFLWWSIGDSGQALFHFAMLEASFCAWLDFTEPRPIGTGFSRNTVHSKNPPKSGLFEWWSIGDSNPGPPACKAGALAN